MRKAKAMRTPGAQSYELAPAAALSMHAKLSTLAPVLRPTHRLMPVSLASTCY
ncbi:hypothetical protein TIFTF001_020527 [Ficus carica]|uniref:Uncharacterized protein n=1 Tax=Ficus carica TaxID=3494 RepID=A0AA88AAX7_FICCA|nr:hypothetical protein TIFTF001_020527 [Ficus carica]